MPVVQLSKHNFKQTIEQHPFVIIDFWAPWCEPCLAFTDTFEAVSKQHADIVFAQINIDADPEIAASFNLKQIPALLVIRQQIVVDAQVGAMAAQELDQAIAAWGAFDISEIDRHFNEKAQKEGAGATAV